MGWKTSNKKLYILATIKYFVEKAIEHLNKTILFVSINQPRVLFVSNEHAKK